MYRFIDSKCEILFLYDLFLRAPDFQNLGKSENSLLITICISFMKRKRIEMSSPTLLINDAQKTLLKVPHLTSASRDANTFIFTRVESLITTFVDAIALLAKTDYCGDDC